MPALVRKFKKIFAGSATNNGVFGSAAALSPAVSNDPATIESLAAWSNGWDAATISGNKLPALQDMQGLKYDTDYHLAYIYQTGMQVYDSQTTYYQTDLVRKAGTTEIWKSLVDNNTGNALVEGANWTLAADLANATPAGQVAAFAMNTTPTGWLECDGSAISRTTYAALFALIGTTFGPGNGTTTFNIPDLRGYFVRGWAHGGSIDSGRSFGSTQTDAFQGHYHSLGGSILGGAQTAANGSDDVVNAQSSAEKTVSVSYVSDGTNGTPRVGTETRPVNLALMYCIKY